MPRRVTPFLPDQYYHFYNRGNNRQAVFFERDNYLYYLRGLKKYVREYLDILCYCLMPTHYHILARVKPQTSEVLETSEVFFQAVFPLFQSLPPTSLDSWPYESRLVGLRV